MAASHDAARAGRQTEELRPRRRFRLRIASLFSLVIGLVVLVSVGTLLAVSTINARIGLLEDIADSFDFAIATLEERVRDHLGAVEVQLGYLAELYGRSPGMRADDAGMAFALRAALAAAPQVTAIAFMRPDGSSVRLDRANPNVFINDLREREGALEAAREAERRGPGAAPLGWSEPLFSPTVGRSILVRSQAVWHGDRFAGLLFAGVDLAGLSRYAREISASIGQTVFILHGRDKVIAHPDLIDGAADLSIDHPMPAIDEVDDVSLARIWREDRRPLISQSRQTRSQGHYFRADGEWQVYVFTETREYGQTPWLIGFYFDGSTGGSPVTRFWIMLIIGGVMLVVFVLIGGWLGRRMSRPFQRLTDNAAAIQSLDFDAVGPMEGSPIVELDRAARAFDGMIAGLRVLERYVPKRLVEMIVREGRGRIETEERQITILFIDIVDFSGMAESMAPPQAAALLNAHFARVGACIEAEGGTIDKYIGDGLLAFWGAPERQPDHAARACRAALAIVPAMQAENARRAQDGMPPIRARIGLHSGGAIVGDIGAESRINYTAIGDAVNVAARVEDEGRHHLTGDVTILITEDTRTAAGPDVATDEVGPTALRGRAQPVVLYRLRTGA